MTNTQKNKIYKLAYEKVKRDEKEEIIRHTFLLSAGIMFFIDATACRCEISFDISNSSNHLLYINYIGNVMFCLVYLS